MKKLLSLFFSATLIVSLVPMTALAQGNWADPNPPELSSVSADRTVAAFGDTVTFSLDVADPDGVESVMVDTCLEPGDDGYYWHSGSASWYLPYGSAAHVSGTLDVPWKIGSSTRPGRNRVTCVTVTDKLGYRTDIYDAGYARSNRIEGRTADFSALAVEVDGYADPNPPELSSVSADRTVAAFGDTVTFSLDVADPDGVESVMVDTCLEPGDDGYYWHSGSASWYLPYGSAAHVSGTLDVPWKIGSSTRPGRNRVTCVTVTDKLGYRTDIYDAGYARSNRIEGRTADFSDVIVDLFDNNKAPDYKPLEVTEVIYHPGSGKGITIRFNAPFDKFTELEIDGKIVPKDKYTVREGSTIIEVSEDYIRDFDGGNHNLTARYSDGGTASADFTVSATEANANMMHRLYNPNSGEHFYTASIIEHDHLVSEGWQDEGVGWTAPKSGNPVYRLYNPYAGEHHYTLSEAERDNLIDVGWNDEGIGWSADPAQKVPLYRVYNPNEYANNHHYTTSEFERDHLLGLGWQDEGIGWHGIE